MHTTEKVRLTVALSTNMSRAVDYLTEDQAAAALRFIADPARIRMPPMALDVMTSLLVDKWGLKEYEGEIGVPRRSAKALLAQALDTYTALEHGTVVQGSVKPQPPADVQELKDTIQYLTADTESIQEIADLRVKYGIPTACAKLLLVLMRAGGKPVAKGDLLARMYYGVAPDDIPEVKIIDVFVCQVRKMLPPSLRIETVWGLGYRLVEG